MDDDESRRVSEVLSPGTDDDGGSVLRENSVELGTLLAGPEEDARVDIVSVLAESDGDPMSLVPKMDDGPIELGALLPTLEDTDRLAALLGVNVEDGISELGELPPSLEEARAPEVLYTIQANEGLSVVPM